MLSIFWEKWYNKNIEKSILDGGFFMIIVSPNEWSDEQDNSNNFVFELHIPIDLGKEKKEG